MTIEDTFDGVKLNKGERERLEKAVQIRYLEYLDNDTLDLDAIIELQKITGIKMNAPSQKIQSAYISLVCQEAPDSLEKLENMTGVKPELSERFLETVRYTYGNLICAGNWMCFNKLREQTGIRPSQENYNYFMKCWIFVKEDKPIPRGPMIGGGFYMGDT